MGLGSGWRGQKIGMCAIRQQPTERRKAQMRKGTISKSAEEKDCIALIGDL